MTETGQQLFYKKVTFLNALRINIASVRILIFGIFCPFVSKSEGRRTTSMIDNTI